MKNVVGMFDNVRDAEAAVRDLRNAGVQDADISFVGRDKDEATMASNEYLAEGHSEAAEGAGLGATSGTVVGGLTGLLVGLGILAIPGVGPVIAAGTLATALGTTALGAGIGAAAGGLLGALVGAGVPEEDAHIYAEGIRRGNALVMARVNDTMVDTTIDIMDRHNVVDIDERAQSYRDTGWSGFDANAEPYSSGDRGYATMGDTDTSIDRDDYDRSSKVGTAGGVVAGAATGAALGSAGGPVGTVIGGVAGAVTGGAAGAAGDAAGVEASDNDYTTNTPGYRENAVGSSLDTTGTNYSTSDNTYGTASTDYGTTSGGYNTSSTSYGSADDTNSSIDRGDYDRSSKVGTAGGAVAGAATGAALGSAGGPVGTVIGGVAGAVTGGAAGAAGDAAGVEASDNDSLGSTDYSTRELGGASGMSYGSTTSGDYSSVDTNYTTTDMTSGLGTSRRSRMYDATTSSSADIYGGDAMHQGSGDSMTSRIENATERGLNTDLDQDGDVGRSHNTNY